MTADCTNLLPTARARAVRRAYFMRLAIVAVWGLAILIAVHTLLSAPAYLYLQAKEAQRQTALTELSQKLAAQQDQVTSQGLVALNSETAFLAGLSQKPSVSAAVRLVLGVPRQGVTLGSIAYTAPSGGKDASMIINGIASTRGALHAYQLALQQTPFVSSVNLPVSVFAKDTNINFTMTVTGSFAP
ncbi:MAG: hypothetical protein B7X04_03740 [Parcubacteria group bacterium 21-54-25]|nr:MAG: hypothetical protein B7X04_03740 [Parcubacteria group bacterium 21-54-25]HQU08271.1 hypothetical protein [Candidatus Paceibacterota bacterium]